MSFSLAVRKRNANLALYAGGYKRGDIIQVLPFDWPYAAGDKAGHWVVRVTGTPVPADVEQFMQNHLTDPNDSSTEDMRRVWRVLVDNVPAQIRNAMLANGEVTVTLAQIRNFIQNQVTGSTY